MGLFVTICDNLWLFVTICDCGGLDWQLLLVPGQYDSTTGCRYMSDMPDLWLLCYSRISDTYMDPVLVDFWIREFWDVDLELRRVSCQAWELCPLDEIVLRNIMVRGYFYQVYGLFVFNWNSSLNMCCFYLNIYSCSDNEPVTLSAW